MKLSHWKIVFLICFLSAMVCGPFPHHGAEAASGSLCTRYNIHAQNQNGIYKASYANYTNPGPGHVVIPAGSPVSIAKITRKLIDLHFPESNINVQYEFHGPRMGMSAQQYLNIITSVSPVSYSHLSQIDRQGIAAGKAFVGMSREGVRVALGYPAAHRTPSLDSPTYIYWTNRFGTVAVNFDSQGKVTSLIK
ncbi:MAG: outer membrane protein assembly factor BamE [Deltaproteobacteria bacterium]|nr:outer membrane protein assembly factor BamE [Deltaproteobacteria bacterium]